MNECTKSSLKETITQRLIDRIENSLPGVSDGLNRFEIDLQNLSPLNWLGGQNWPDKIYFAGRDNCFDVAAVGNAKTLTEQNTKDLKDALNIIDNTLASSDPAIKFYGGICFDLQGRQSETWKKFGRYRFTVPKFEMRTENQKNTFAYNIEITDKQDSSGIIEDLKKTIDSLIFDATDHHCDCNYTITNQKNTPGEKQWNEIVTRIINDLSDQYIQKVVLARMSKLQTSTAASPIEILKRLKNKNINTYSFCFQTDNENAFIGCTPECLFKTCDKDIYSEALAGTRLKGSDSTEQNRYRKELLESRKEQLEHDYVYDDVYDCLNDLCDNVEVESRLEIVALNFLQHFCSRFKGHLKNSVTIADIIDILHPTAAVNGFPYLEAIEEIRKYETFSRGWFAGPVGWIAKDSAHFAVAIRSALIQNKEISLFAGAGIVKSSDPASEWQETENKIKQFLEVLT